MGRRPRAWRASLLLALALATLGCRRETGDETTASTVAPSTTSTAPIDVAKPQTATGANGNPRDDRIGPPANNRPSYGALDEGVCFNEFLVPQGEALLHQIEPVDCAGPHDAEVYAALVLEGDGNAPFPGERELIRRARAMCLERFDGFVGLEYAISTLRIAALRPSGTTWTNGDRRVVCSVYDEDLEPLVGTARSSGR